jgi:ubiquinone/menaquinone biosynthesis C-methylase UbiE
MGKLSLASLSYRSVDEFEYISFSGNLALLSLTGEDYLLMNGEIGDREEYGAFTRFGQTMITKQNFRSNCPSRVIKLLTDPGDIVLDCFIGSGTTAIAAIRAGRRYIGIDVLQKYVNLARNRVSRELQQISMEI